MARILWWRLRVRYMSVLIHSGWSAAALTGAREQADKANMAKAGCTNLEQQNEGGGLPTRWSCIGLAKKQRSLNGALVRGYSYTPVRLIQQECGVRVTRHIAARVTADASHFGFNDSQTVMSSHVIRAASMSTSGR
ncbi:hypothetical protein DNF23_28870 [Pseudomonas syringae pv. pisi]